MIMIDPGHGGSDPGHEAVEKGQLPEKELNLIIAMKFGAYLSEKLDNVKVLYTRTSDTYLTLMNGWLWPIPNMQIFLSVYIATEAMTTRCTEQKRMCIR